MKSLLYCAGLILLFASGVCRKTCDDYTVTSIAAPIEDYFGAYKQGNWWVYQNTDGTKKDSIYLIDYSDKRLKNATSCYEYQERKFTMKTTQLLNGVDVYVDYVSHQTGTSINFSSLSNQTQTGPLPQFIYQLSDNRIYAFPANFNQGNSTMSSVTLNGQSYQDILVGKNGSDAYYFSKNKGLVGWTANGTTFHLINYKIL